MFQNVISTSNKKRPTVTTFFLKQIYSLFLTLLHMYHGIFSLYMNIVTYICPPTVSVMWKILAVETTSILYNTLPVVFNGTRAILTRTTCTVHNIEGK